MKTKVSIIVKLVHIEGPMKGIVNEHELDEILIGRHVSCHVRFPKTMTAISRYHARIVRDGNRFSIVDTSTNGCFVNGRRIRQQNLKPGDVIIFTEGGPKVSFLTEFLDNGQGQSENSESLILPSPLPESPSKIPKVIPAEKRVPDFIYASSKRSSKEETEGKKTAPEAEKVRAELHIQYGPTLHSFFELPVMIGSSIECDVVISDSNLSAQHIQVVFTDDAYGIIVLTGRGGVKINGLPVNTEAVLSAGDTLSLTEKGPVFIFLKNGRLAEASGSTSLNTMLSTDASIEGGIMASRKNFKSKKRSLLSRLIPGSTTKFLI